MISDIVVFISMGFAREWKAKKRIEIALCRMIGIIALLGIVAFSKLAGCVTGIMPFLYLVC